MAIIKPGFTPGFRGRAQAPAWNRRAHYLASQNDRDSARLLGMAGEELQPSAAIEVMGGSQAGYHEVIVAPGAAECATIRARCPEDPQRAAAEAGQRITKAYALGRPYVLAIHEQEGRFHFHIAVAGPPTGQPLGKHGKLQKEWDREVFGDEPRIQDWAAHLRFKEEKARLQLIIREQKANERQRQEAVQRAAPGQKADVARPFEQTARVLIERRHGAELAALQARYEARGALGTPRHQAEVEQADHRRTGALHRLENREVARDLGRTKGALGRGVDTGGRVVQQGARAAGSIGRAAVDAALREMGVPAPARTIVRAGMALGEEALQTALRASLEAARAAAQSSIHLGQASVKIGVGLMAALPTGGASLTTAGKEAGQDLAQAGKELGQGAARAGVAVGKGAGRAAAAGTHGLLPRELGLAINAGTTMAKTAVGTVKDIATLSPVSLAKTLASGAVDITKTAANAAGLKTRLPEPVRLALQAAGWIPIVGIAAKAAEVAAQTALSAVNAATRGLEVDR